MSTMIMTHRSTLQLQVNVNLHPLVRQSQSSKHELVWCIGVSCKDLECKSLYVVNINRVMQSVQCFGNNASTTCMRHTHGPSTSWRPSAIAQLQHRRRRSQPRLQPSAQPRVCSRRLWPPALHMSHMACTRSCIWLQILWQDVV